MSAEYPIKSKSKQIMKLNFQLKKEHIKLPESIDQTHELDHKTEITS